jgi:hypothetical protein
MKTTLTTEQAIQLLLADPYRKWTYNGARAIVEYLEEGESDCDDEWEFDVTQIRCEWCEYPTAVAAVQDGYKNWEWTNTYDLEGEAEAAEKERCAMEFLCRRDPVITFEGGVLVANF